MDTVIGLGNAGCNIVDVFSKYPQYLTYKLDVGLKRTKTTYPLKEFQKIEDYEEKLPSLKTFFKDVEGEILFVVGGAGKVSCTSLKILEYLKKSKINVLYVRPELSLLNPEQTSLERLVFNVFQEYARSGLFERMYIVSNSEVEQVLGGLSIKQYNNKINEMIVSTIHMINIYNHNKSLTNTFCNLPIGTRITTIGLRDPEKKEDKMFFSLDNVSDIVYYYAYNKESLETDSNLMSEIKKTISSKKKEDVRVTYGIFETDYEQDYIYCLNHTSVIQK
tara:strand:+ start:20039 stop:20869 length:831 start_codon:yes stop_codon:yes gene_type:complete